MPAQILEEQPQVRTGGPGGGSVHDEGGGGDGSPGVLGDPRRFGLLAFLGTVSMLFIGFTSAYIVRRTAGDWRPLDPPGLLWVNTVVLLASSVALERARRLFRGWQLTAARPWVAAAGLLGALFVTGQLLAWRALAAQGIYLATSPHSSFFYLLTGIHGVHLLGGLVWFALVLARLSRMAEAPGEDGLSLLATYWHFLAAVWIYLLLLLFVL